MNGDIKLEDLKNDQEIFESHLGEIKNESTEKKK